MAEETTKKTSLMGKFAKVAKWGLLGTGAFTVFTALGGAPALAAAFGKVTGTAVGAATTAVPLTNGLAFTAPLP